MRYIQMHTNTHTHTQCECILGTSTFFAKKEHSKIKKDPKVLSECLLRGKTKEVDFYFINFFYPF